MMEYVTKMAVTLTPTVSGEDIILSIIILLNFIEFYLNV